MNRTLGIVLGLLAIGTLSWAAPGELVVYPTLADYEAATGNSISSFGEAPILAQRVAAGELREVADRLPDEPLVVDPLEGIGQYGGTFQTGTIGPEIGGFPGRESALAGRRYCLVGSFDYSAQRDQRLGVQR